MKRPQDLIGLKALRSFHAIVATGSATEAGRSLGITQPAISRLLAQMEAAIGFALFHRDRGRLVPTADALLLFDEVDLSLGSVARVHSVIRDIAEYRLGRLKLVAPPSFSEGILPDIVASFLKAFPKVHLTIESRGVESTRSLIATRAVDAGFMKLPVAHPDLDAVNVARSAVVCVMRDDHRLAARETLDPASLLGEPLILLGLGGASRAQIDMAFVTAGQRPRVHIETHTVGSACALAARGLGIALVNEMLATPSLRDGLVQRPFYPQLLHEYAFVTSTLTRPSRLTLAFLDHTQRHFA